MKRLLFAAAVAAYIVAGFFLQRARAQEVEVSVGLICDTQKQVESYVEKFTTAEETLAAVNLEANDPQACIVTKFAYVQGNDLSVVKNRLGSFWVVEIVVVGVETHQGMMQLQPALFYSLRKVQEDRGA